MAKFHKSGVSDESADSDEQLLAAYCHGDCAAFELFFRRHVNRVYAYALKKGVARDEASEVVQEVFLKLHLHILDYEIGKKALPWFFTIVHNTCIDWLRRQIRNKRSQMEATDLDFHFLTIPKFEPVFDSGTEVEVVSALQSLPQEKRKIVEMRIIDELSFKDISEKTGRTEIALRKSFSRSVQLLRKWLQKPPEGDA